MPAPPQRDRVIDPLQELERIRAKQHPKGPIGAPRDATQSRSKGPAGQGLGATQAGNFVNTIRSREEWDEEILEMVSLRRGRVRGEKRAADCRVELLAEQEKRYTPHIIFEEVDEAKSFPPNNRALLITAEVAGRGVARILIGTGSSVDIIYANCLKRLNVGFEVRPLEMDVIRGGSDTSSLLR